MARSFHQSLLAAVVALVVGGSALAQTPLQEAVRALRLADNAEKKEAAVNMLREIVSSDPSNEEAHNLYTSVSQDEWYMLMAEQGEIQKIARLILERAKVTQRERSRDEAAISSLVDTACDGNNDYGTRQQATSEIVVKHGEFAVPALLEKLGNDDDPDGQIYAISVCVQLNTVAVLPLIEALSSSNATAVQNAAAALNMINDKRALPMMAHLASDDRANVRTVAEKFVAKHGKGDALELMLGQSNQYLKGIIPVGGFSDVIWQLQEDKLVAVDVPALLYPTELAKSVASTAVKIANGGSLEARSALASANLAQAYLIENSIAQGDESVSEMADVAGELKIAAMASGVDALRSSLDAGVQQGMAPVAIGAIGALADAEIIDSIEQSSLLAALNSTDKRVKYAAAAAIVRASRGNNVPQLSSVVGVLADAVTEEHVRSIHVIAPDSIKGVLETANANRQDAFFRDASALTGINTILNNPSIDVLVINEVLPDRLPEDVIGNLRKDDRHANTKVVVIAKDVEAATERFGEDVGYIASPVTTESLAEAVNTALEGVASPAGDRAEGYAGQASSALRDLASRKADITGALNNLALQLNRGDAVAVPAAQAIGLSGGEGQLGQLCDALAGGSDDLKKASATAIGNVLSRMANCPADVAEKLGAAMDASSDAGLRRAIAIAFGKAKIDAAAKTAILNKLHRVAGSSDN